MSFKDYLHNIKPTKTGILVIVTISFLFPLFIDIIILAVDIKGLKGFSITTFMIIGYAKIIFFALIYHVFYFILKNIFMRFTKK